jgi:hypothetical protein
MLISTASSRFSRLLTRVCPFWLLWANSFMLQPCSVHNAQSDVQISLCHCFDWLTRCLKGHVGKLIPTPLVPHVSVWSPAQRFPFWLDTQPFWRLPSQTPQRTWSLARAYWRSTPWSPYAAAGASLRSWIHSCRSCLDVSRHSNSVLSCVPNTQPPGSIDRAIVLCEPYIKLSLATATAWVYRES